MELTHLPGFGLALVEGKLDELSTDEHLALRQALEHAGLIVARKQFLTRDAHVRLALRFGPIDEYDTRVPNASGTPYVPRPPGTRVVAEATEVARSAPGASSTGAPRWRLDGSFKSSPVWFSTEAAVDIGSGGWATSFVNLELAFERLDPEDQARAEELWVWHSAVYAKAQAGEIDVPVPGDAHQVPGASHPLVMVHPATRRKGLYLGENAVAVEGLDLESGRAVLDRFVRHVSEAPNPALHVWEQGDVVLWDSRFVAHRRLAPVGTTTATIRHISIVEGDGQP